ncbi:MAG: 5-(carboxyamino)imidazole ribonucleotide synthase [Gemmatimonadota bacterium]
MILPGATIGLLGGGQLGRMFAAEAVRMGYKVVVLDPDPHAPAAVHAWRHVQRPWTDPEALQQLVEQTAAITTEFENVPAETLRALAAHRPVRPSADAVAACQDRRSEKAFLNTARVETVAWGAISSAADLDRAWRAVGGGAAILKTARLGYDGKGQVLVDARAGLEAAFEELDGVPCVLEARVALVREISVMVARGFDGAMATWPVGENVHRGGILHSTVVPSEGGDQLAERARGIAQEIASALEYVGVLGVEFFVTTDGALLVNEIAPRPHNSGHWTLDASVTSQFEQQVRALTGLPLGDTTLLRPAAMINLLGDLWADGEPEWGAALAVPGVRLHLYGKTEPRPGRKMGHLTAMAGSAADALAAATKAWDALTHRPNGSTTG